MTLFQEALLHRIIISPIQIDLEIDKSFQSIGQLNILVNMQNPQMTKLWLPKINKTEENLLRIIDTEFADDARWKPRSWTWSC